MRRRTRWASWMILAVSAAWCAVVWIYSLGERRERLRLVLRVAALESSLKVADQRATDISRVLDRLRSSLESPPSTSVPLTTPPPPVAPPWQPRVLGYGQSRSLSRRCLYADVEIAPSNVVRRYTWLPPESGDSWTRPPGY